MTEPKLDLTGMLGARICHDLISPVGAICNGLELLELSGTLDGPEKDLIESSAKNANARLQFYRIAFGMASGDRMLSPREINQLLSGYTDTSSLSVHFESDAPVSRSRAQLIFLTTLCLESALARNGEIAIRKARNGWALTAQRDREIAPSDLLDRLVLNKSWPSDLTPRDVHFPLAAISLQASGYEFAAQVDKAQINARLTAVEAEMDVSPELRRPHLLDT